MGKYAIDFTATQAVRNAQQVYLDAAFSIVAPKGNWKGPIDAMVPNTPEMLELIEDAIVHFTGSFPEFQGSESDPMIRVRAAGYYTAIGA